MRLVPAGEFVHEPVERGARLLVFRQRRHVVVREAQMEEGRTQNEDERDHRDEYEEGPTHDRGRDRVPPARSRRIRLQEGDAPTTEIASDDREERRKERQPVEDSARDHDRTGDTHR